MIDALKFLNWKSINSRVFYNLTNQVSGFASTSAGLGGIERLARRPPNIKFKILAILSAVFVQYGCASIHTKEVFRTPEATAELKIRLGIIGVTSAQFIPRTELLTPLEMIGSVSVHKTSPAGRGISFKDFKSVPNNEFLVARILLAPLDNSERNKDRKKKDFQLEPLKDLNEKELMVKKSLGEMKIQETLRNTFLRVAREKISFSFELIRGGGPVFDGEIPDYRSLKESGIDTIQEMEVKEFGWIADGSVQPNLSLFMNVQVRLVSALTNKEIFNKSYHYQGEKRKFKDWMDSDGLFFINENRNCYQNLAEKIMKDIYLFDSYIPYIQ